ncbi:MAG: hypothetical protein EOO24_46630, partial [Comamonadaceae bacterium]
GLPYLLAEGSGPALLADLCGSAELVASIAARMGYRRAVIDLQAATVALSFTDHLQLGTHVAKHLSHLDRVASIVRLDERKGTSEKAAQKMGLHLRTFTDRDEALAWIGELAP